MTDRWTDALTQAGAILQDGMVVDFGNANEEARAALNGDVVADLSQFAILEVSGDDATNFLGGQLTGDVRKMDISQSQLTAWCSAQGKVVALFRVLRRPECFWLLCPRDLNEILIKRFRMFVLRAKVEVRDRSDTLVSLGLSGDKAAAVLSEHFMVPPAAVDQASHGPAVSLARIAGEKPRYIAIGSEETMLAFWQHAAAALRPVGPAAWTLTDIETAQPWIVGATREQFLPQVLNLDLLGGVSFNKGCYPGQEVITRLKFRGQVKQRLFPGRTGATETAEPGTRLLLSAGENSIGEIVLSAPHPDGGQALLAAVRLDLVDSHDLHLGNADGPECRFRPPPYGLES